MRKIRTIYHRKIRFLFSLLLVLNALLWGVKLCASFGPDNSGSDFTSNTCQWESIKINLYNPFNPKKPNIVLFLRPSGYAKTYKLKNVRNLKAWLYKLHLSGRRAEMVSVNPLPFFHYCNIPSPISGSNMVTGIYIHDSDNVYTWKFKDNHGYTTLIHATPNHPFYVKNLKKFLPLNKIQPDMELLDYHQHVIRLVCPPDLHKGCGILYHPGKVTTVYNMEVAQQHQYFVSDSHILVHNCNKTLLSARQDESRHDIPDITAKEPRTDKSDKLIVGCGSVPNEGSPICYHPDIDTVDFNKNLKPTYSSIQLAPLYKYKKILIERSNGSSIIEDMQKTLSRGNEVYLLAQGDAATVALSYKMLKTGKLTFNKLMEPEEARVLLTEFGTADTEDLGGKDFFFTDVKKANAWIDIQKENGMRAKLPRKQFLLKYTVK